MSNTTDWAAYLEAPPKFEPYQAIAAHIRALKAENERLLQHIEMMVRCPEPLCDECRDKAVALLKGSPVNSSVPP